ncbi:hypothetical protein Tco_0646926 [Tanacetum coccineum]
MTSLADKSLLSGGDNKPPMLEKHLYDSWKSRMELYMMNRPHGRMILASVEKGPLVWPSITEDGVTRLKEYVELTPAEAIQADCDIKAINIILQGLPTEIYALVSQHRVAKDLWEKIKLLMQGINFPPFTTPDIQQTIIPTIGYTSHNDQQQQPNFSQSDSSLVVPVFQKGDDPIDAINHMMSFLTAVVTSRYPTMNNQLRTSQPSVKQATSMMEKRTMQPIRGDKLLMLLEHQENSHLVQVVATRGNRELLFVIIARGRVIFASNAQGQRGKGMTLGLTIKVLLVQAQRPSGQSLTEDEIAFLARSRDFLIINLSDCHYPNATYQSDDLMHYDCGL